MNRPRLGFRIAVSCLSFSAALLVLPLAGLAEEQADSKPKARRNTIPNASADEPLSTTYSAERATAFLDSVAVDWTRKNRCGACHTNNAYLMVKPIVAANGKSRPSTVEVRSFYEDRVRHWDDPEPSAKPRWDAEVVSTATALAVNDRLTTGKLHETTRKALDRMWTLQQPDGSWNWLKAKLPPYEYDDYHGAVVAALGVGFAPDGYARSKTAAKGLEALRGYFEKNPPPNLHHETMLLWASTRLDGLMTEDQRSRTIAKLRVLQRSDGGWCLPSLGSWSRRDGRPNDPGSSSDGFATGLVVFVMREAGIPRTDAAIQKGVDWLKKNQRTSGRWFTRSLNTDNKHLISNAGTAFALMAIDACEEPGSASRVSSR